MTDFKWSARYVVCALLALFAMIFLGAVRYSGENAAAKRSSDRIGECRKILSGNFAHLVREEHRASWNTLLERSPELVLRIHASEIRQIPFSEAE